MTADLPSVAAPRRSELDPIEIASRDEIAALQLERLKWTLRHAYDNVAHYRDKCVGSVGASRRSAHARRSRPASRSPPRRICAHNYPFGMFAVPRERLVRACMRRRGTTGKPTVVGYTERDIDTWADLMARSIRAVGRQARRHRPRRLWLRPVHRRARRALRRRAAGLHRDPGLRRHDRAAGAADPGLQARHHHGDAVATCWRSSTSSSARGSTRAPPRSRSASSAPSPGPTRCATRSRAASACDAVDIYGLSEVMGPGVANECIETKDGLHHLGGPFLSRGRSIPTTGAVLPDGENGELVFTTLTKEALPVIRYRTRDLTRLLPATARSMRRMEKITGRTDDMLIIRGVNVFPTPDRGADPEAAGALRPLPARAEPAAPARRARRHRRAPARRHAQQRRGGGADRRRPRPRHQVADRRQRAHRDRAGGQDRALDRQGQAGGRPPRQRLTQACIRRRAARH